MTIRQVTASGEEHGLLGTLPNAVPDTDFKNYEPSQREELRKKKKEDARLVKVRFINHLYKNEPIPKNYCRHPGEPIQVWKFIPGYEYTVPYGLVEEVNNSYLPKRSGLQSVDGNDVNNGAPLEKDGQDRLYEFVSTKF